MIKMILVSLLLINEKGGESDCGGDYWMRVLGIFDWWCCFGEYVIVIRDDDGVI